MPEKLLDKGKTKIKIEYVIFRREVRQTKDEKREGDGRKTFSFKNKQQISKYVEEVVFMIEAIPRSLYMKIYQDDIKPVVSVSSGVNLMQSEMKIIIEIDWSFWRIYKQYATVNF